MNAVSEATAADAAKAAARAAKAKAQAELRAKAEKVARVGRPTVMTTEVKERLLEFIAGGMPNREACAKVGIEPETLYNALHRDLEFFNRYDAAKKATVDALVDRARAQAELATAATNGAQVQGRKLMWDHEWREAQRLAPNRWGEKAQVEITGRIDSGDPAEISKRLAFIELLGGGTTEATTGDDDEDGADT